jgi:hypothetical protein
LKIITDRIIELAKDAFYSDERQWLFPLKEKILSLPIQQSNEWIDINEKEPEPDTNNLVCYYWFNNHILVAEASCDCERNWKDLDFFIWMTPVKITHWQPLPTPHITNN